MDKSVDTLYFCADCGSSDTYSMAWVSNKDDSIDEWIGTRVDEENNFCGNCNAHVRLMSLFELWKRFSEIEVNEDDEIQEDFLLFDTGTDKMEVWHWFDERCPNGLAVDLMGEESKTNKHK